MKIHQHLLIPAFCFFVSTTAFAYEGGHGGGQGGYHGGGGSYHNNGNYHGNNVYHNNGNYHDGYHNNEWYGGSVNVNTDDDVLYDDGIYDESPNVVVGVPSGGYYDPSCQTVQTCNSDGECVTQQSCD